jgi:hypothetical protein
MQRAWFLDQYKHPHESKHILGEVIGWFESSGFAFTFSIPKIESDPFRADERLFDRTLRERSRIDSLRRRECCCREEPTVRYLS